MDTPARAAWFRFLFLCLRAMIEYAHSERESLLEGQTEGGWVGGREGETQTDG